MGLDPRSMERLRELGRSLPKPLPKPEAPPTPPRAVSRGHRVETETDPEALFRELMRASPDGTVPPHLLERLRQLEASRLPNPGSAAAAAAKQRSHADGRRGLRRADSPRGRSSDPGRSPSSEQDELYAAFQQLLLEDDDP